MSKNKYKPLNHGTEIVKKVKCIETDTIYKSGLEAQKYTGIDNTSISDCCRGKAKSAHGFHFIFADEGGI